MDDTLENQNEVDEPVEEPIEENPKLETSILTSIKKLLGITADCTDFDTNIIMHINTVFMTINQLGVGPDKPFVIEDDKAVWKDFLEDDTNFEAVKSYIHLKVRLIFDPPLSTAVREAMEQSVHELEWRLNVQAESFKEEV